MMHADVETKARELIGRVLGPARTEAIVQLVWHIDEMPDAAAMVAE